VAAARPAPREAGAQHRIVRDGAFELVLGLEAGYDVLDRRRGG
jgi:hypothetical protein